MADSPRDILLRRIQIFLGILAAVISISVGIYNFKKASAPEPAPPPNVQGRELTSALEEVGADWIRKVAKPKE